ncbi:hypothetical protein DWX59_16835 [Enterocloster aldenensis]|uniref:hypothetical protein n=1 Tax=Enterocloster aldenensis TaxID=358742 RepID=UPI000E4003C0|nr:hypothetical protein DWX59_16835 [Enterocloster aldenensis]
MRRDYEEDNVRKPIISYLLMIILLFVLLFLLYSNVTLSKQVSILHQQISSLTLIDGENINYATQEDIETTRKQIGNLQDAVYDISIKINSIESTLDDMTSFIGLDSKQQEERNEIINQIRQQ